MNTDEDEMKINDEVDIKVGDEAQNYEDHCSLNLTKLSLGSFPSLASAWCQAQPVGLKSLG